MNHRIHFELRTPRRPFLLLWLTLGLASALPAIATPPEEEEPLPWIEESDRVIAKAITDLLTSEEQDLWLAQLVNLAQVRLSTDRRPPIRVSKAPSSIHVLRQKLDELSRRPNSNRAWRRLIEIFNEPQDVSNRQRYAHRIQLFAWANELTSRACRGVVDDTEFRNEDYAAIFRLLARARVGDGREPQGGGVLAAMHEPAKHRTRPFQAHRIEIIRQEVFDATENDFGVKSLHHIWFRYRNGNRQPMLAITERLPGNHRMAGEYMTWIEGRFLKHLAYEVGDDLQVAPVFVGRMVVNSHYKEK